FGEARDQAQFDRIDGCAEHDRNYLGRVMRCDSCCRALRTHKHRYLALDKFSGHGRQSIRLSVCHATYNRNVLAFDIAGFPKALTARAHPVLADQRWRSSKQADDRHSRRLLRPRCQWARRRAAEQREEIAPFHSITSSAVASSVEGTAMPSSLAVRRLITSS